VRSEGLTVRRVLPVTVAVIVLAAAGVAVWWFGRTAPIPSTLPTGAPAVGSCWNEPAATLSGTDPFPGRPVPCTGPHTAEVYATGQVQHQLLRTERTATGQAAAVNRVLINGQARAGCSGGITDYLGGQWRRAQVTIVPALLAPAEDGFFACAVVQVSDPGGTRVMTRSAPVKGILKSAAAGTLAIDCYAKAADASLTYVPCGQDHAGEFVGVYTVTPIGAPFNGAELQTAVTGGCQQLVNSTLALAAGQPDRTDLRASYVGPTDSVTWLGSDQSYACYAVATSTTRGSISGLGNRPLPR
jgi:Septum formation